MRKIFIFFLAFIVVGCSTKREYFEPENLNGEVKFSGKIPSKIVEVNKYGAVLKNGLVISQNGLESDIKLSKNDLFLGKFDDKIVISNTDGTLKILRNNNIIFKQNFKSKILSAQISNDQLAVITSNNIALLIDIKQNKIITADRSNATFAQDARVARPIFTDELVLFPMLDGVILVASKNKEFIKHIVVSSEYFFNNIFYFEKFSDRIYAATSSNMILVSQNLTKNFKAQIKDIIYNQDKFFVFLKDGGVKILNKNLEEIEDKKFDFAIFSNVIATKNAVYAVEKQGYLIKISDKGEEIFDFPTSINDKTFVENNKFYYDDRFIEFE